MNGCTRMESGTVELYFYDELDAAERAAMTQHLASCRECRLGLDELETIRTALATRPVVTAPPGDDWSGFMAKLQSAIASSPSSAADAGVNGQPMRAAAATPIAIATRSRQPQAVPFRAAPYLAIAATLMLAVASLLYVARSEWGRRPAGVSAPDAASASLAPPAPTEGANTGSGEAAFAAMSEQHFERSKLVVLGIASKDARRVTRDDWEYERQLASSLLSDTRLYRLAAEERGMKRIADVMGDLELVLLQTSLGAQSGPDDLEQIQRLIDKRDLVTKMDLATGI